jgi:hypothetical protein
VYLWNYLKHSFLVFPCQAANQDTAGHQFPQSFASLLVLIDLLFMFSHLVFIINVDAHSYHVKALLHFFLHNDSLFFDVTFELFGLKWLTFLFLV